MSILNSYYFIFVLLALIAFTILFKKEKTIPKFLRICVFFLILGCIFEPLFKFLLSKKPWILVLVDTSKSMGVGERLEKAKQILPEIKFKKKIYGFDAHPYPIQDSITAKGSLTNIGNALLETPTPSAYLLLSDGLNNSGSDPIEIAQRKGIPIYSLKIGDSIPKDIRISGLTYNKIAYTKDNVPIKVRFENIGYEPEKNQVLLKQNSRILQKKRELLPTHGMQKEVEFSVSTQLPGTYLYEVSVSELPGEMNKENNKREFGIRFLKSRIKVGWFSPAPSWNFKFARLELTQDERIDFEPWIKIREGKWLSKGGILGIPDFENRYDALILEGFDYPGVESLVNKGTGVVIIGEACKSILPFIDLRHKRNLQRLKKSEVYDPIEVVEGFDIFGMEELPSLKEVYEAKGIKGGARVLCRTMGKEPLIAKMEYGKGLIVGIAADDIWRWNFYSEIKFWGRIIRLITLRRGLSTLFVETKPVLEVGERVTFEAEAYTQDYNPDPNCEITVKVYSTGDSGSSIQTIPLYSLGDGRYKGAIDFLAPGKYKYEANTREGNYAKGEFLVVSQLEFQELASNQDFLQTLSEVSGGKYAEDMKELDIKLKPRKSELFFNPSQYLFCILFIILLLSVEWLWLRR